MKKRCMLVLVLVAIMLLSACAQKPGTQLKNDTEPQSAVQPAADPVETKEEQETESTEEQAAELPIVTYLKNDPVADYEFVEVKEGILSVGYRIHQEWTDAETNMHLHSVFHVMGKENGVGGLNIRAFDADGNIFSDSTIFTGTEPLSREEREVRPDSYPKGTTDRETIELFVQKDVKDADITGIEFSDSDLVGGKCLKLVLMDPVGKVTGSNLVDALWMDLEAFSFDTGAIRQCRVTVTDSSGTVLMYMGGDFYYGDMACWFDPEHQNKLIDFGPPD